MTSHRSRVLIVDDNENMRNLLRDILGVHHELVLAEDGAAAMAWLDIERFDLILTDVRMPGPDGFELVRFTKQHWPLSEVVLITAYASVPAAVEAMRLGAYDYLVKPFDPDDVILVVTRALERHRDRVAALGATERSAAALEDPSLAALSYREALVTARDRGSREYLQALLKSCGGNVSHAAERAGLERESLHRLLRRHGIRADEFRDLGRRRNA